MIASLENLHFKVVGKKLYPFIQTINYPGFLASGGTPELWDQAIMCNQDPYTTFVRYPASTSQVSPSIRIEKSIHLSGQKYANYQVKQFVDVKRRDRHVWNLVGNGESYPTVYNPDGSIQRAGCGFLYKDEGLGCLNVDKHANKQALVKLIAHKCMRPQCPVDYEFWAAREASRIEKRFMRVPKLENQPIKAESRTKMGVPIHVVISVPELEADLMDMVTMALKRGRGENTASPGQTELVLVNHYKKLKKKMAKIAKKVGFLGGCTIFHPFANDTLSDEDTDGFRVQVDPYSGEFDYEKLKEYFRRQNARLGSGNTKNELKLWYIRPHFHLIGYGWIEKVDQIYAKTGWVVKNLGVRDSVFMTALYQLSHAGYREGQHTVSWIGVMSNRMYKELDPLPELPKIAPICPDCGDDLRPVRWVGEGISPLDEVKAEGHYYTPADGWEYIPDKWIPELLNRDGYIVREGYWEKASEYRGRVVKPTDEEKDRRRKLKRMVAK